MRIIKVAELEMLLRLVINKLRKDELSQISISTDLYRFVPTDKWDSFESDIIEAGSLFDDIDNLMELLQQKDRECTYVDFDRIASLLRVISQIENPI